MHPWLGFSFVVLGGMTTGTYFLGLKYVSPWKWENIWLAYALFALLAMPLTMAWATVPHLLQASSLAPRDDVLHVILYGAGFGVGSVLSGLGVARLGMALGVSVLIGVNAAAGAVVPMAFSTPDVILTRRGLMIIFAVLTLLVGVGLVGFAGKQRELSQAATDTPVQPGSLAVGLAICVFSGIFSAMMNFAFVFGRPVARAALSLGADEVGALNLVWLITLAGGFVPTGIYTGYLLSLNHTWKNYLLPRTGRFWLVGLGMALLWYLGVVFYGRGAAAMGRLGGVVGWPLLMAIIILTSNAWGFLTGEWKRASLRAKHWMAGGLVVLMLACALLCAANQL
jgi:L-rhamnose-H+ transport protein